MQDHLTWVVVANSAQARLFKLGRFPELEQFEVLSHKESRLHDQDLVSSRPGRNFERSGVARHAYEPKSDPKQLEIEKFAREISHYLSEAHQKGSFSRLYLLASPAFLGVLRQHITPQIQALIVSEIAKDMSDHEKAAIEKQLSLI